MKTKICSKCGKEKDLEEFNKKASSPDGRAYYCRVCNSLYLKEHYRNNKDYYNDKRARFRQAAYDWFKEYKTTLVCEYCSENHPACLEFHHLNPEEKEVNLAEVVNRCWTVEHIEKEIAKCIVLCANCHRKLHYKNTGV